MRRLCEDTGTLRASNWLDRVEQALLHERFRDTILQAVEPGQVFGLVKRLDPVWEMHARGFEDETATAEIELSRDYFEHLDNRFRRDATRELTQILDRYGIPYAVRGALPQATVIPEPPRTLTPWKPLVAVVGTLACTIAFLWVFSRKRG